MPKGNKKPPTSKKHPTISYPTKKTTEQMRAWLQKENPAWGEIYVWHHLNSLQVAAIYTKQNNAKARRSMNVIREMLAPKRAARRAEKMQKSDEIL